MLRETLFALLLLSALFPWSPPIINVTDLQPLPLIFGALYCTIYVRGIKPIELVSVIVAFFALLLGASESLNFNALRGIYPYVLFAMLTIATHNYFNSDQKISIWIIYVAITTWYLVGIAQLSFPDFGHKFLSRNAVTSLSMGRGVSSLAPEPTFYAIHCLLVSIFLYVCWVLSRLRTDDFFLMQVILWTQLLLLSRSTLVIILIMISVTVYCIFFRRNMIFGIVLSILFIKFLSPGRLGSVFNNLLYTIQSDHSVSDRIAHIFYSHYYAVKGYLVPNGFNSWQSVDSNFFSWPNYNSISEIPRILSLSGSALFELGLFGVPLVIFMLVVPAYSLKRIGFGAVCLSSVLALLMIINAVPLALPMIAIIYGSLMTLQKKDFIA